MTARLVLAFAGHVSDAAVLRTLRDAGADVVTLTLDLGQRRDLDQIRSQALAAGARRAHVLDLRDAFADECLVPALRAGRLDGPGVFTIDRLGHPLIAGALVEVAAIEGASTVAHASSSTAIDRAVAERAPAVRVMRAAAPASGTVAPLRDESPRETWNLAGRVLHVPAGACVPAALRYRLTADVAHVPSMPARVDLTLAAGRPVALNGVSMPLTELVESLTIIAGRQGIGRVERHVSIFGTTALDICEAPALTVLLAAREAAGARTHAAIAFELSRGRHRLLAVCEPFPHLVHPT